MRQNFQHILLQILTTVSIGPSLPNGCLRLIFLPEEIQSFLVGCRLGQLFGTQLLTAVLAVMYYFTCICCTHHPRSGDRSPHLVNLSALIQQALYKPTITSVFCCEK